VTFATYKCNITVTMGARKM